MLVSQVVETEKLYECTLCTRKFAKKTSLVAHSASHATEQGKVACSVCGLFFLDETELNRHSHEHEDACRYACTICPRRFKRKQQYEAHMEVRSSIESYGDLLKVVRFFVSTGPREEPVRRVRRRVLRLQVAQ